MKYRKDNVMSEPQVADVYSRLSLVGSTLLLCQFFENMLCQVFFDFSMARHGLTSASYDITIPVMASAMTHQSASRFLNFLD
jgi:hypothetical protein